MKDKLRMNMYKLKKNKATLNSFTVYKNKDMESIKTTNINSTSN
jgi:hypothetical protein